MLEEFNNKITKKNETIAELKIKNKVCDVGPCFASIDTTLKSMGVERQAYCSQCFNGNHCHVLLMEESIDKLCNSISAIVYLNIQNTNDVYDCTMAKCELFKLLLKKYAKCHVMMNSARLITENEIISLQNNINEFMMYLRCNWPNVSINPKLHMLEDHVIPFISRWHVGCDFYGEQESIHASINKMKGRYSSIKKDPDRLKYIMNCHLSSTNPNCRSKRVVGQKRNLKRI